MADNEFLLVGLGNPGQKYHDTRHNVGFLAIDMLVRRWNEKFTQTKFNGECVRLSQRGSKIIVIKPMTYMNRSGQTVADFARFYKIAPENIVVLHDDLDMHPGRLKLVFGGGAGGHNGIRSITSCLGTNGFHRLKIGIGRPGAGGVHEDFPVEKYVLSPMVQQELDQLNNHIDSIEEGLNLLFKEGKARAMNLINSIK